MNDEQKKKLDALLYTLSVIVGQLDPGQEHGLRMTYLAFADSLDVETPHA